MNVQQDIGHHSLFQHEADAITKLKRRLSAHRLGFILNNLEVHDPQSNRYFETDVVIICGFGIYVVELKHWSGRIEIRPDTWLQNNSFFKRDPHISNGFKAKLLRGIWERKFPSIAPPYFESVIILTNPDAEVDGASIPKTTAHNPTFDTIDSFIRYLKYQRNEKHSVLTESQCSAFKKYLYTLQTVGHPRDFIFPGYEIIERLYQHTDRAEVVARRTDIRHHRLSRLRVFFPSTDTNEGSRQHFHERATATLNTVSKTGDHPNILKVWPVPNENNYIVEGSDWSETGTLRDLLKHENKLSCDRAEVILIGILQGLKAVHSEYIVHRSLSPKNILMMDDIPKLMNFDLSFQLEEERVTVIPDVSQLQRNPYTAPEIYKGEVVPEATADLFSVGVILYEMLTGERPFGCSTDLERLGGHLENSHNQKMNDNTVPESLKKIILNLVCLDPDARLGSVDQVIEMMPSTSGQDDVAEEANAVLETGTQSGIYQIDELFRHGAESQIYRGRGARGRHVAIKLFNYDVPLSRVIDEQHYATAVHHPSIVRVDSYNHWDDRRSYISFNWISQRNMRDEINEGKCPDLDRFQLIALQLLDAVEALHGYQEENQPNPILHNDIKPENILIDQGDRPVLIDFGAASPPQVGIYEGTEGYVAPDLCLGQDRKYCEDGDLYALGVTLREWLCGQQLIEDNVPISILLWLKKATAQESRKRFSSADEMRDALTKAFKSKMTDIPQELVEERSEEREKHIQTPTPTIMEQVSGTMDPNPFVTYLNSLHSRSVGNENALAESQSRNTHFGLIHVRHPVANTIQKLLTDDQRQHVILTGHAGDGKSTIAIDLYKQFNELPSKDPLPADIDRREDVVVDNNQVTIIKDFSEWSQDERLLLLSEMLDNSTRRFFLISNTGTLLDTFRDYERLNSGQRTQVESELLKAMDSAVPKKMRFYRTPFSIINLSMVDNIGIAEHIFRRMINPERWRICQKQECHHKCPIFRNVQLIQQNESIVRQRLFLVYRRMYEYGTRFTLRQLSAHLAYMITSGLSYQEIIEFSQKASPLQMSKFMFFNRFFGDNGRKIDTPALQLHVVSTIRKQGFGVHLCPSWERRLWLRSKGTSFRLKATGETSDFDLLREYGTGLKFEDHFYPQQAREQVRRMLFFLHEFDADSGDTFIKTFLNSIMILEFVKWQEETNSGLTLRESTDLHRRILHVLQEHFTGVRLPEGTSPDRFLYITLGRRIHEVRQSAQVVLAQFLEDDFKLELETVDNGVGSVRRELVLKGRTEQLQGQLRLSLPFLDYVMMRNEGEIGKDLQASYIDRLEKFKGQLLNQEIPAPIDDIRLVSLRTNHMFRRQKFSIREKRLEVTDG